MFPLYRWVTSAWLLIQAVEADWEARAKDLEMMVFGSTSLSSEPRANIVRIGTPVTLDRRTQHAVMGGILARTYQLFVNWLNDVRGGINIGGVWHKAELVLVGDESDADLAANITEDLIQKHNITLLFGPYSSTLSKAVATVASSLGATMLAPSAADTSIFEGNPQVFGMLTPASEILIPAFAAVGTRVRSVSFFKEDTGFTNGVCSSIPDLALQYGMEVVGAVGGVVLSSSPTAQEVQNAVADLKVANPQFLVGCVYTEVCKAILKEMKVQKFSPLQVISTICVTSPGFAEDLGEVSRWVSGLAPWTSTMPVVSDLTGFSAGSYAEYFETMYAEVPPYQSAATWASGEALVTAIERAGSADAAAVAVQLRKMTSLTVFGRVHFDENGQNTNVFKVVQFKATDLYPRIVYPPVVATDEMTFPMPSWADRRCFEEQPIHSVFGIHGNNVCGQCPDDYVGEFNATLQRRVCRGCGANRAPLAVGFQLRACHYDCPSGYIDVNMGPELHRCMPCPNGRYQTGHQCKGCGVGKYSYERDDYCRECLPGRYNDNVQQSYCKFCPKGSAISAHGASHCDFCQRGRYTNETGVSQCILCSVGRVAEANASSQCAMCQPGFYSIWDGSRCEQCAPGRYQHRRGASFCFAVRGGADAPYSGMTSPFNKEGFWQKNSWSGEESSRSSAHSWEWCVKKPEACLANQKCAEGHTGRQCASCVPRTFADSGGSCTKCWPKVWYLCITAFLIILLTIAIGGLAVFLKKGANRPQDVHSILYKQLLNHLITASVCSSMLQHAYAQLRDATGGYIGVGYWALFAINWGYGIMPSETKVWSVTCMTEWMGDEDIRIQEALRNSYHYDYTDPDKQQLWEDFRDQLWYSEIAYAIFWATFPFFMICFACSLGYVALYYQISRNWNDYSQALDFYSSVYTMGFRSAQKKVLRERCARFINLYYTQVLYLWSPVQHIRCYQFKFHIDTKQWLRECMPVRSAVIFQTFGCVVYGMMRAVRCHPIMEDDSGEIVKAVIADRAEIECKATSLLFILPLFGLFCWCVIYPAILFTSLRAVMRKKAEGTLPKETIVDFALFVNGYSTKCWYWEVLMYLRKGWLIGMGAVPFSLWHEDSRALAFLLTALIFGILQIVMKPYDQRSNGLLNTMERYQLAFWTWAACGLIGVQNPSAWPIFYAFLPISLVVLHYLYIFKVAYHIFKSVCISLVSTDTTFRPDYIKSMNAGIARSIKEIILRHAMAEWNKSRPYIALDPYYGWVTLVGAVVNEKDLKAPHITKGVEARKDKRFPGLRPPLSMVGKLVREDLDADFINSPTPKRKDKARAFFKNPDHKTRKDFSIIMSEVMSHLVTGNIDAESKSIDPETGQPVPTSQTFSVSIFDFVIRAAFVLHKLQKDLEFGDAIGGDDAEDVEPGCWQEANRQRNPLVLLEVDEETKLERERRDRQNRQAQIAKTEHTDLEEDEDKDDLELQFLQDAGRQMQAELRDSNSRVIMSKVTARKVREAEHKQRQEADKIEDAMRGGIKSLGRGATQISGIAWGLPTTLTLVQSEAEKIIGQGENDNGSFTVSGRGHVDGTCMLEVQNRTGTFALELLSLGTKGEWVGRTLDSGYEGKTGKFVTIDAEEADPLKLEEAEGEQEDDMNEDARVEMEKSEEAFRRAKRREKWTKVVDQMFSPNLFNKTGLRVEDLQNLALQVQRTPKEDMIDWLDLFEDRWSIETAQGNSQLMRLASMGDTDRDDSKADGLFISKGTQFPETVEMETPKVQTLDDIFQMEAPTHVAEGYAEGMEPIPRSAMVLMSEACRFEYSWEDELRAPLKSKLNNLRQHLGVSKQDWEDAVEVTDHENNSVRMNTRLQEAQFPVTVKFVDRSRPVHHWRPEELKISLRWVRLALRAAGGVSLFRPHMVHKAVQRRMKASRDNDLDQSLEELKRRRSAEVQNLKATETELAELQGALEVQHTVATPRTARTDAEEPAPSGIREAARELPDEPNDIAADAPKKEEAGFVDFPMEVRRARPKRSCRACGFGGGDVEDSATPVGRPPVDSTEI